MKTMKALIKEEEVEGYVLKDMPEPVPESDEVLIKVDAVAICGSDIALYKWTPIAKVQVIHFNLETILWDIGESIFSRQIANRRNLFVEDFSARSVVLQVIATVPFIPGHEATGTVVRTGPQSSLREGQRVAVENHFFCGSCYQVFEKARMC